MENETVKFKSQIVVTTYMIDWRAKTFWNPSDLSTNKIIWNDSLASHVNIIIQLLRTFLSSPNPWTLHHSKHLHWKLSLDIIGLKNLFIDFLVELLIVKELDIPSSSIVKNDYFQIPFPTISQDKTTTHSMSQNLYILCGHGKKGIFLTRQIKQRSIHFTSSPTPPLHT